MLEVSSGVRGKLHAEFVAHGRGTAARLLDAAAPLELRGPFDGDGCSRFYLRNVSCGVLSGDAYDIRLSAREGTYAHVSGTSATKVHAMPRGSATSDIRIASSPGAALAYFDGPTILQAGANLTQRVELVTGGRTTIYAEVIVFGRLARKETMAFDRYRSELLVRSEQGEALYVERYDLRPGRDRSSIAAASLPVLGKVICAGSVNPFALLELDLPDSGLLAGFDELPSGAGVVLRAASDRLEPVTRLVEGVVAAAIRRS